jgi:hypothetical protein
VQVNHIRGQSIIHAQHHTIATAEAIHTIVVAVMNLMIVIVLTSHMSVVALKHVFKLGRLNNAQQRVYLLLRVCKQSIVPANLAVPVPEGYAIHAAVTAVIRVMIIMIPAAEV